MRDSFVLFTKIDEVIEELNDAQVAQLFRAIVSYEKTGEYQIDDPIARVAFIPVRQELDLNNEKWDKVREARSEAGKQGGRPQKQTKANAFSEKQTKAKKANAFLEKQTKAKKAVYVNVNDNVNDNVNVDVNVDVNENDFEKENEPPTEAKERKHTHGEHGKVKLTDSELAKLSEEFGEPETLEAIAWFDAYIAEKGYKSKSHYLAMRRWVFDAVRERRQRLPTARSGTTFDANDYLMQRIREAEANDRRGSDEAGGSGQSLSPIQDGYTGGYG